uniref:Uncharacterized protein n=1 Tax=Trichuris muris TaxID=70415 RepID=A0A5S6QRB3_TRIMR
MGLAVSSKVELHHVEQQLTQLLAQQKALREHTVATEARVHAVIEQQHALIVSVEAVEKSLDHVLSCPVSATAWHQPTAGRPVFIAPSLRAATHVFVRIDSHRQPLQPPYKGPYRVLERGPKSFVLDLDGAIDSVSADRLKPAFLLDSATPDDPDKRTQSADHSRRAPHHAGSQAAPYRAFTRSGRPSRRPRRFSD